MIWMAWVAHSSLAWDLFWWALVSIVFGISLGTAIHRLGDED